MPENINNESSKITQLLKSWADWQIPAGIDDGNICQLQSQIKSAIRDYFTGLGTLDQPLPDRISALKWRLRKMGLEESHIEFLSLLSATQELIKEGIEWSDDRMPAILMLTEEEALSLLPLQQQVDMIAGRAEQLLSGAYGTYDLQYKLKILKTKNNEGVLSPKRIRELVVGILEAAIYIIENLIDAGDGETGLIPSLRYWPEEDVTREKIQYLESTLTDSCYLRMEDEELSTLINGSFFYTVFNIIRPLNFLQGLQAKRRLRIGASSIAYQEAILSNINTLQGQLRLMLDFAIELEEFIPMLNKAIATEQVSQTEEA